LREHVRKRNPDVSRADDRDVRLHVDGRLVVTSASAMRRDACPSPYSSGRSAGIVADAMAAGMRCGSSSTRTFAPTTTVSTHSVEGRSVTQGTPYQYASFCRPPESVAITRARDARAAKSR